MTANTSITQELELLAAMVNRANGEIAAGGVIDLQPLETKVREVCGRLDGLPGEEAAPLRATLIGLLDELGQLERRIAKGLEALAEELGQSSRRREAVSAYGSQPAGKKP